MHEERIPDGDGIEEEIPKNIDEDLQMWIDAINPHGDASYTCTLYKFDHPRHGNRKEFCGSFEDESPCLEEIGNRYGGGRYLLYVVIYSDEEHKKKQVKSYKFKINDFFSRKNPVLVQQAPQAPQVPQINQMDVIAAFKDLLSAFLPLLVQKQDKTNISDSVSMVNSILKDSARSQIEMIRDFRNEIAQIREESQSLETTDDTEEEEEETTGKMGIIEMIEPLLEKYLPVLLGNGPQSKMAIAAVKAVPEFKRVMGDQQELSALVQHIIEKEGKDSALKLMKKLKINSGMVTNEVNELMK